MTQRILLIIPTLDPHGAEKQLTLLATGLPRDRFDVHVCALTRGGPMAAPMEGAGIPLTVLGKRWKLDPATFVRLVRHIRRLRPALVHTWLFAANAYGRAAGKMAGVPRMIAAERCVDEWKMSHELAIDRRLARWTDRLVANSCAVRDFYAARGLPLDKFAVISNGVSPAAPSTVSRAALLDELGLPQDAKLIGAVGRLWPQKRVQELIWAIDQLGCLHDNVYLLVIGDGPMRSMLERYSRLYHAERRVLFLGMRSDVPRLVPHFDIAWLASGYEGQSNALMEAMSAGVPVVATDIPANRELVVHGESGMLVPVDNRAAFASTSHLLLEKPDFARRLGAAAQERMLAEFSVERMVDRYTMLYRELLP